MELSAMAVHSAVQPVERMNPMTSPILFTWNLNPSRLSVLREICAALSVPVRPVAPQEAEKPLAALGLELPESVLAMGEVQYLSAR